MTVTGVILLRAMISMRLFLAMIRVLGVIRMSVSAVITMSVFRLRIQTFRAIFRFLGAIFPGVSFTGNKGKHTDDGERAKNDPFHVRRLFSSSQGESKA